MSSDNFNLETVLTESRRFGLIEVFKQSAHINSVEDYRKLYATSINDPEKFWSEVAEELHWFKGWDKVVNDDNAPFYKWFENGKTNISFNCIDRHLFDRGKNKAALVREGEPGDTRVLGFVPRGEPIRKRA